MFNELNELESENLNASENVVRQKDVVMRSYNSLSNIKLVISFFKLILPIECRSRTYGKWSPTWEEPFNGKNMFFRNVHSLVKVKLRLRL